MAATEPGPWTQLPVAYLFPRRKGFLFLFLLLRFQFFRSIAETPNISCSIFPQIPGGWALSARLAALPEGERMKLQFDRTWVREFSQ